jgi:hypothetical protein
MWRTGTSAKSWDLRRQGRYKEADVLLVERSRQKDVEACFTLYSLQYPGGIVKECMNASVLCSAARGPALGKGHPVAEVIHHELRNSDPQAVIRYAASTGHAGAMLEAAIRHRSSVPLDIMTRVWNEDEPEALMRLCEVKSQWMTNNHGEEDDAERRCALERLAWIHRHPVAAWHIGIDKITPMSELLRKGPRVETCEVGVLVHLVMAVNHFEVAAAQGHRNAAYDLARVFFSTYVTKELRNPMRAARLLVYALRCAASLDDPEIYLDLLCQRLMYTPASLEEYYYYGKVWPTLPKADTRFPSDPRYCEPTGVKGFVTKKTDLGSRHPVRIYNKTRAAVQSTVVAFLGCVTRRRVPRGMPRDVGLIIAKLVWEHRGLHVLQWIKTQASPFYSLCCGPCGIHALPTAYHSPPTVRT